MPVEKTDLPTRSFTSAKRFRTWLQREHARSPGLWLQIAKQGSGHPSVTYAEALEIALCHGWIDGQKAAYDETWYLQRFTPRRARSPWSQRNREIATRLVDEGLMQPAGLAEIERARADGRWDAAYAGSSTIEVPADFRAALDAEPAAREAFEGISRTNRFAFLYRINDAKRPQTRAARIEKFVAMLKNGETLH